MKRPSWISPGVAQMLAVAGLTAACTVLAALHLAVLARPAYVLGALGIAMFYIRQSPWAYITLTLWFWSTAPFARRVVDYFSFFTPANIMLLAPNVLALLMLKEIVSSRDVWRRPGAGVGLLALAPMLYGLMVSFVQGDVVPGIINAADWLTPVIYYYYAISLTPRIKEAEPHFRSFVILNMTVVGLYGLYQYISPPLWDSLWVLNSKMNNIGEAVPYGLKPFSTLNSPGVTSMWIAMLLVLSLHFRNRFSFLLLPVATLVLAVTLVRSAMGVAVAGIVGACLLGGARITKSVLPLLAALAMVVAVVSILDPKISETLVARLGTVGNLSQDDSAQVRMQIYAETPGMIDSAPFGMGIGAFGRGARYKADSQDAGIMDSGPLEIYMALGWVPGTFYVVSILAVTLQAVFAARATASPAAMPFAMAAMSTAGAILFVNLIGPAGITIWLSAGMAIAIRAEETLSQRLRAFPPAAGTLVLGKERVLF